MSIRRIKRNKEKQQKKKMQKLVRDAKRMGLQLVPMVPNENVKREEIPILDLDWEEEEA